MMERWPELDEAEREFLAMNQDALRQARKRHAGCPDAQLVFAMTGESLPEGLRARLANHLKQCASCRLLAETFETQQVDLTAHESARMRARLAPAFANSRSGGNWYWLRSLVLQPVSAIAIVALLGAITFVVVHKKEGDQKSFATIRPTAPELTLAVLPLDKPPIPPPATSELVFRGTGAGKHTFDELFDDALARYEKNDYLGASAKLKDIEKGYPKNSTVKFYNGICLLFLNHFQEAVGELQSAKQGKPGERSQATWYLAVAQQRSGHRDLAAVELQELCQAANSYSARACEALKGTAPR
jgi:TolA-binding protein